MRKIILLTFWMGIFIVTQANATVNLAKINGKAITDKDLELSLMNFQEAQKKNILKDKNSRVQLLSNIIDQELLAKKAQDTRLDQSDKYKNSLEFFKKQLLAEILLEKEIGPKITEKELKKYYNEHVYRYSTDASHVLHILAPDEASAREIMKLAREENADFQSVAEQKSIDPNAKNNRGDIGYIDISSPFVEEFKEAVFMAKKGSVTGPIKTSFGYHVIKVVERKMGHTLGYDEVELRVKAQLMKDLRDGYVYKLKESTKVEIDYKAVENLNL